MSVIDNTDSTKLTEHSENVGSYSKSAEKPLLFLRLGQLTETSFQWESATHTVADAPPEVFDAFIAEGVEQIINVDRSVWLDFDRWNVINECLAADVLTLTEVSSGSMQLAYPEDEETVPTELLSAEEGANDVITESS